MGRQRKRFNQKLRSNNSIQTQETQKVDVIVDINDKEKYDASNPLVIIKKKKKIKLIQEQAANAKPLSRKQRKKLKKIIETKKKKANRAELLKKLSEVQASNEDLIQLTSTTDMQTHGIKRLMSEVPHEAKRRKIRTIKGSNKKPKKLVVPVETPVSSEDLSDDEPQMSVEDKENSGTSINPPEIELKEKEMELKEKEMELKEKGKSVDFEKKKNQENEAAEKKENKNDVHQPTVHIPVQRKPEIQAAREALPIFSDEQPLMEGIRANSVIIIQAKTGSGKTTQIPQFLYEAGYAQNNKLIGITQPRRIAAMTMAARVGEEMNMPDAVSYQIRYENTVNSKTQIKFMTDGVLLKEIKRDAYLSRYSVIIIDEAHERTVFTDALIGLLCQIVRLKNRTSPLKLIIMSATMSVEELLDNPRLFPTTPYLYQATSRQFTVTAHFNKQTPDDYVEAAYWKVCKIHNELPRGSILVFLTGEEEINRLCKMLKEAFPFKDLNNESAIETEERLSCTLQKLKRRRKRRKKNGSASTSFSTINLDDYNVQPLDIEDLQNQWSGNEETPSMDLDILPCDQDVQPLHVLPLYSVLPLREQEKVFQPPPPGSRLCVVSTNVAETSITIPGLKYVVDSGKVKTKVCNGGISQFVITWCSKASANQRAGRAGRTEGGHCYRLYSSAVFNESFPDFCTPEITRIPVDDIVLQLKAMGINDVIGFPFPTAPDIEDLKAAEKRLVLFHALEDLQKTRRYIADYNKRKEFWAPVTKSGELMARFPLSPRYSHMLLLSKYHKCIHQMIAIICAMTVPQLFLSSVGETPGDENDKNDDYGKVVWKGIKKIGAETGKYRKLGDAMVFLRAVALYEESKNQAKFCYKNHINHKSMIECHKMAIQLIKELNQNYTDLDMPLTLKIEYPSEEDIEKLRRILACGFIDHVARKVPYALSKLDKKLKNAYQCMESKEYVFIHPSSILFQELPEYIVYQEINVTSKHYMKGVVAIEDFWLPEFAPSLCKFGDPKGDPWYDKKKDKIYQNVDVFAGPWSWEINCTKIELQEGYLKYQYFMVFFLDGQVFEFIKNYRQFLKPTIVLKSWAKSLNDVMNFLKMLMLKKVDSKAALKKTWTTDSRFLVDEFLALTKIPKHQHLEVQVNWPPKF